ncbi:uncharacterized protein GGS22DRAFT_154486 [Annulohypoxylon maeteangense]|uniref:uncharacterized protein n=1 Tax=Annulohypoxylon maeteangense TaxID=1927788 RepID=UPI002007D7AF|nr:uncharacterized protein GGS22DRAFT_154486 [Annulohypoxylon maeteangense]KAI0887879.1 hypothetical protein GGS22DRAFT_154486 [Annulohypoxylon maeteangense]
MVGVPRSKRCDRCKRIKVKCDETWPTCTPCLRAKVPCSGPPNLTKFINNGRHTPVAEESTELGVMVQFVASGRGVKNLKSIRQQALPNGAQLGHYRLSADEPRKALTTVADRVASRFVGYLAHESSVWDMLASAGYNKHLPVRLSESAALRDSVALMCSTWTNYRRNVPPDQIIDTNLYGKALRSLQRSLSDHQLQLRCETLAAATLLERLELIFDTHRPFHRTRHSFGISSLLLTRGPPNPNDELDMQLALENHASMISHWLVHGGENFYLTPPWASVIQPMKSKLQESVPAERLPSYTLGYYYGFWPGLVHEFRRIIKQPDEFLKRELAIDFRDRVATMELKVKDIGESLIERALLTGRMAARLDPETPIGGKFHFESLDLLSSVMSYGMIRTVLNRLYYHITDLLGEPDVFLELEHQSVCRSTWMCIPFIRGLGMVPSAMFTSSIFLSCEGADEVEMEYLLKTILEMTTYSGRYPKDKPSMKRVILNTAKALTGRGDFAPSIQAASEDQQDEGS